MAIEDMPARIHSHNVSVIEFRADERIAFAINFVAGKTSTRGRNALRSRIRCCFSISTSISRARFRAAWRRRGRDIQSNRDGAADIAAGR